MLKCVATYSAIGWTKDKYMTAGKRVQPDETLEFDATSNLSAMRTATKWGGVTEFGNVRWVRDQGNTEFRKQFTKSVREDSIEIKLTLRCRY